MPTYVVYTKEVHTGKYVVEAENADEAIKKVHAGDFEDQLDNDFEYFHRPENGGWSAWSDGAKEWSS